MKHSESFSQKKSSQYRQTIESLKHETKKLKEQLYLDTIHQTNSGVESEIARLQEQGDFFAKKIELEVKKINEYDVQIQQMNEKLRLQRESLGAAQNSKEANEAIQKKMRGLENKLDKSLQKYNEATAHNKRLRDQIDKLRRERVVYDGIYKKLEEELQAKKEELVRVVKKSQRAQQRRDEAKQKLEEFNLESLKEQETFTQEWKELGKLIEHDKREREEEVRSLPDHEPESQPSQLQKKVAKSAWNIAKDKASIKVCFDKVEQYEEAFKKIEEATGISDVDELVKTFMDSEVQNRSLLNRVNELNIEMETLEQEISDIKQEIEKYKASGAPQENLRQKEIREIEYRLDKTEEKAKKQQQQYAENRENIQTLQVGIAQLFEQLGCSGLEDPINEHNILQYMGAIEEKANDLINAYTEAQLGSNPEIKPLSFSPIREANKGPLIHPPSVPDRDDPDEEESTLPMSFSEIKSRTLQKLEAYPAKKKLK